MIRIDSYSSSNSIGPYHSENQDSLLIDSEKLLFGLADGVGGYQGAKVASSLAMEILSRYNVKDEDSLRDCLLRINYHISSKASELGFENMGTTISVVKVVTRESRFITANVGDSPILLLHDNELRPVYHDDSYRNSDPMLMSGIIQYLGLDKVEVHTQFAKYSENDILLICSDGITDNLLHSRRNRLEGIVHTSAKKIVEAAISERTKPDDMTAILLFF